MGGDSLSKLSFVSGHHLPSLSFTQMRRLDVASFFEDRIKNLVCNDTVDGRNPANQLIWLYNMICHYLQGFIHPRWFSRRISEPSTVCPFLRLDQQNQWCTGTPTKPSACSMLHLLIVHALLLTKIPRFHFNLGTQVGTQVGLLKVLTAFRFNQTALPETSHSSIVQEMVMEGPHFPSELWVMGVRNLYFTLGKLALETQKCQAVNWKTPISPREETTKKITWGLTSFFIRDRRWVAASVIYQRVIVVLEWHSTLNRIQSLSKVKVEKLWNKKLVQTGISFVKTCPSP